MSFFSGFPHPRPVPAGHTHSLPAVPKISTGSIHADLHTIVLTRDDAHRDAPAALGTR